MSDGSDMIPPSGKWPEKPEWRKKLDAALADAKAGRGTLYENEEEFLAALRSNFKKSGKKKSK